MEAAKKLDQIGAGNIVRYMGAEWAVSDKIPRLPVNIPIPNFIIVKNTAAMTEPRATCFFSSTGIPPAGLIEIANCTII